MSKPIGQTIRESKKVNHASSSSKVSITTLEEQIKLLQSKINDVSSDDDTSDEENDDACVVEKDSAGNIVKIVSSILDKERIEPLRKELLPSARCSTGTNSQLSGSKRIRFNDEIQTNEVISGLEKTVREMVANYKPISLQEKKPFYCRVCNHQANNNEEFEAHKLSEFHSVAVKIERNHRYCRHCSKEFTSPEQLKGHIEGKAHKEQVARLSRKLSNRWAPH